MQTHHGIDFTIDREFQAILPPLASDEIATLERNILADGRILSPLTVWREKNILLDGHHRLRLAKKHKLPYGVESISLPDRDAARLWIIDHGLGTRILTPDWVQILIGTAYNIRKKAEHDGGKGKSRGSGTQNGTHLSAESTAEQVAADFGVSKNTVIRAAKVAAETASDPELQAALKAKKPIKQVKRERKAAKAQERRAENAAKVAQTAPAEKIQARFATIVIDPPWDWGDEGDVNQLGRAKPQYSTMPIGDIEKLPVPDLADVDCHLYLWITNRSLPKGFRLIEQWGFRYITCLTWCKPSFGMGNYFRGSTEHMLFAVKGSQALLRKDAGTWFPAERGKGGHSSKPEESFALIESCSPGPRLEMFSRSQREGWTTWGGEL